MTYDQQARERTRLAIEQWARVLLNCADRVSLVMDGGMYKIAPQEAIGVVLRTFLDDARYQVVHVSVDDLPGSSWAKHKLPMHNGMAYAVLERHGGGRMLDKAFEGFLALPAPGDKPKLHWRDVFSLRMDERVSIDLVKRIYRTLAQRFHPDNMATGDAAKFSELNNAMEEAEKDLPRV